MSSENESVKKLQQRRNKVFKKLKSTFFLPSPSGTIMELVRVCNSEDSSVQDVADLIQTDPSLSAEIIKYANSSLLSTGIQVASVQKATVKLGMKNVVSLAMGLSMMAGHKSGQCEQFDYQVFWQTCLAHAIATRELSRINKEFDPDELFVCALLSQMGRISLATLYPEEYSQLLIGQPTNCPLREKEFEVFGIDSAELTSELFLDWGMPAHLSLAAGFYRDLGNAELGSEKTLKISVYLYIADIIAEMCQSKEPLFDSLDILLNLAGEYNIHIGIFHETFGNIVDSWHESGKVFNITTTECCSYDE